MLRLRTLSTPALAMMALAGCNPARSDLRQKAEQVTATIFNSHGDGLRSGQRVEPKFCKLDSAMIARSVGDRTVDSSLWEMADEQTPVGPELRQSLEANGLRVGIITGELPADVLDAFKSKPGQVEAQWVHIALPDGEHTPIVMAEAVNSVTLFLNHGGKVDGRDYQDAAGRLLVTPRQSGQHDVEVRIVPEILHGEKRRTIGAIENAGSFAPQEFAIKDAKQGEILRELAATIEMKPGQTLVIGCRPTQARTLGTFLFLQPEAKSDRMLQTVLLVQASRNNDGTPPLKVVEELAGDPTNPSSPSGAGPASMVSKVTKLLKDEAR